MCGLFGSANTKPVKNLSGALLVLALENQSRGRDSWGATNGKDLIKSVGTIERQWHQLPLRNRGLLMAHTRAATVGKICRENSHPFEFKGKYHVIGAHNGHVSNWQALNARYKRDFDVDSMHIFAHIAEGLPLDEIEGSGAITFLKDDALYFARFNGGSLAIANLKTVDNKPMGLVWSSTSYDLKKALDGCGVKYTTYNIVEGNIYYWADDKLYDAKEQIAIKSYRSTTTHGSANSQWMGNQYMSRSHSNAVNDKRVIRLRVMRSPATPETAPIDTELEEIKKRIFSDTSILTTGPILTPCNRCKQQTTLRLLNTEAMCLTCVAKMVKSGELVITPAVTVETAPTA